MQSVFSRWANPLTVLAKCYYYVWKLIFDELKINSIIPIMDKNNITMIYVLGKNFSNLNLCKLSFKLP